MHKNNNYIVRNYQQEALKNLRLFVKDYVKNTLNTEKRKFTDVEGVKHDVCLQTAALIEMATGSGKTFTMGSLLNHIYTLKTRFEKQNKINKSPLRILVLSNRIKGIEQLKTDFIDGDEHKGKKAILLENFRDNLKQKIFYGDIYNKSIPDQKEEHIVFTTFESAQNHIDRNHYFDIIIVDEAHNIQAKGNKSVLKRFARLKNNNQTPLIFGMTATPNEETKKVFGESIAYFPVEDYIKSPYAPHIQYKLITTNNEEAIREFKKEFKNIQNNRGPTERETIREMGKKLDNILSPIQNNKLLIEDLNKRIDLKKEKTIIFTKSIEEAEEISKGINEKVGGEYCLSFHSKCENKNALEQLKDNNNTINTLVVVDILNESIDIPNVNNIVFGRGTNSERLFKQQFGRGLHGKEVTYYDYVGGITNFAWLQNIIPNIIAQGQRNTKSINTQNKTRTNITTTSIELGGYRIDLHNLLGKVNQVKIFDSLRKANKEDIRALYKTQKIPSNMVGKLSYHNFAKKWNIERGCEYGFKIPETWGELQELLGIPNGSSSTYTRETLNGKDFSEIFSYKETNLSQLQELYKKEEIDITPFTRYRYEEYSFQWNQKNTQAKKIRLPNTIESVYKICGLKEKGCNKENLKTILSGNKIIIIEGLETGTKEKAQELYKKGILKPENLTSKKWEKHSKFLKNERKIQFPTSFEGFISLLLGEEIVIELKKNKEKIPRTRALAQHLLGGGNYTEYHRQAKATQNDILGYKEGLLKITTQVQLDNFLKDISGKVDVEFPKSIIGMIHIMGGKKKVSSGFAYFHHLLDGGDPEKFSQKPRATLSQIKALIQEGSIKITHYTKRAWDQNKNTLNKKLDFIIPAYDSLKKIGIPEPKKFIEEHTSSSQ